MTVDEIAEAIVDSPGDWWVDADRDLLVLFANSDPLTFNSAQCRRLGAALIEAADWLDARAEREKEEV